MNAIKGKNKEQIRVGTYWLDENNGEYFLVLDSEGYAPHFVVVLTWIEDEDGKRLNAHKELVPFKKFESLTFMA